MSEVSTRVPLMDMVYSTNFYGAVSHYGELVASTRRLQAMDDIVDRINEGLDPSTHRLVASVYEGIGFVRNPDSGLYEQHSTVRVSGSAYFLGHQIVRKTVDLERLHMHSSRTNVTKYPDTLIVINTDNEVGITPESLSIEPIERIGHKEQKDHGQLVRAIIEAEIDEHVPIDNAPF